MSVKYFNPMTNLFILRVGREETPTVWAAATLMTAIHNRTVMVRILKTSGALRKAQAEIIAHDKRVLGWVEIRGCGGNLYVYIYVCACVCDMWYACAYFTAANREMAARLGESHHMVVQGGEMATEVAQLQV